jgi:hypothetical protein
VMRARGERGSTVVFFVVFLAALVGMLAFVLDVGAWFRAQRNLQGAADAATLAAAQDLPNTAAATTTATTYAGNNITGLNSWTPTFPNSNTIDINLSKPMTGVFTGVLGITSITVHAHARATVGVPTQLKFVAPLAVKSTAACTTAALSCFGQTTSLNFADSNLSASRFGLITLDCEGDTPNSCSGNGTGASTLSSWITNGYPGTLDVNKWYGSVTGQKIGPVRSALDTAATLGTTLLFPVFDAVDTTYMSFHVIGWAAFVIDPGGVISWKNDVPGCTPNCKLIRGHFVEFIAHDVSSSTTATNYGVRTIGLIQ